MKLFTRAFLLSITLLTIASSARAVGWPAGFEGVMLQGFYWDSYQTETKWTKLEARADELAPYFKLIWVPNGGKSSGGLGYIPIYWFSNHNSDMGTEAQLRSMIATYKAKGTGIMTDLVINHRGGRSNWADFPTETWNGQTWHIGMDGICRNDEINNPGNPGGATGAYDEGENFDGGRDLDHTNANVQNNCKNYCKFLLEDMGYIGYRIDMTKGYAGYYTKMYNQYAKPQFSVGEYWDGSYDALATWIENAGWESATFDFAFKYAVNEAFASGDLRKLVWKAEGTTDQPAGLIHHWYQQMAVTFIDNHDTYRDDWNKFNGNWAAANAFMICSPGTPCVFLPHWNACGDQIALMIDARNAAGISNTSPVKVLKSSTNCYMAELTGSKGKLAVKIGSDYVSPEGYSDSEIFCSGEDYCIWVKKESISLPSKLYVLGDLSIGHWATNKGIEMTRKGSVYTASNVNLQANSGETKAYFSFVTTIGTTGASSEWDSKINSTDRYGASTNNQAITVNSPVSIVRFKAGENASSAYAWGIAPGNYDIKADFSTMQLTVVPAGTIVDDPIDDPVDSYTLYWDNTSSNWSTPYIYYWGGSETPEWPGVAMKKVTSTIWSQVIPGDVAGVLFDYGVGAGSTVSGSQTSDFIPVNNHLYNFTGDQGVYHAATSVEVIDIDNEMPSTWYNLQGQRIDVDRLTPGIYIELRADGPRKVIVK